MVVAFPPGCPPDDAAPKPGVYFRLCRKGAKISQTAGPETWLRPYETPKGQYYKRTEDPEAHGISVFADVGDLRDSAKICPWLKEKPVAEVKIQESDGVLRHSPHDTLGRSHHDWWTNPFDFMPTGIVVEVLTGSAP